MPAIAAMDNETLDHLLSVVDDARNLTGVRALSKPGGRDQGRTRARPLNASEGSQACLRRISGGSMPVPLPGNRQSGLAGVGGLQRSSRLLLALVGDAVAHQGHLEIGRASCREGVSV